MEEEPPPPYPGLPHEKGCLNDVHPTGQTPSAPPLPTEANTSQEQDAQIQVSQGYGQSKTRSENTDDVPCVWAEFRASLPPCSAAIWQKAETKFIFLARWLLTVYLEKP